MTSTRGQGLFFVQGFDGMGLDNLVFTLDRQRRFHATATAVFVLFVCLSVYLFVSCCCCCCTCFVVVVVVFYAIIGLDFSMHLGHCLVVWCVESIPSRMPCLKQRTLLYTAHWH